MPPFPVAAAATAAVVRVFVCVCMRCCRSVSLFFKLSSAVSVVMVVVCYMTREKNSQQQQQNPILYCSFTRNALMLFECKPGKRTGEVKIITAAHEVNISNRAHTLTKWMRIKTWSNLIPFASNIFHLILSRFFSLFLWFFSVFVFFFSCGEHFLW